MLVAAFLVIDKANQIKFVEKTFLVANTCPEVVLKISFLTLSGADVNFSGQKLCWRTYTIKMILPTTKRVELIGKKEFVTVVFDPKYETYVVHI